LQPRPKGNHEGTKVTKKKFFYLLTFRCRTRIYWVMTNLQTPLAGRTLVATLLMTALLSGLPPGSLAAQGRQAPPLSGRDAGAVRPELPPPPAPSMIDDTNARQTRERLRQIFDQYPPSVAQVLRLDPTLLGRADYLAPYPMLGAFIGQHPEVAHNPGFYIGEARFSGPESDKQRAMNMTENVLGGLAMLTVFAGVIAFLAWLLRAVIDYRYWLRASKVQTDANTKVFDRLTTNEEVMSYVQSPAGQRFLSSTSLDAAPRAVAAPISRILWSVQAGIVLALAGIGLWFAKGNVIEEIGEMLYIVSILAVALGVGFVLSALVSYVLSQRLGLFDAPARSSHG
jgi:hypothetical protein